jgi:hypothetical protein
VTAGAALILALLQGVAGLTTLAAASSAPPSAVIAVIVPSAANVPMVEALTRLRGEAASVGFEIRLVESPAGVEPPGQLDLVAREIAPAAVVALVGKQPESEGPLGAAIGAIDVWFLDRTTGKTSVGHLSVDKDAGDRAELVLAVRVVDFIRARMFDSLVRSHSRSADKLRPVTVAGRRTLALGVVSTGSSSGFSPAFLPYLEVGYAVRPWLRLTLGAGGFGAQPHPVGVASTGSATLAEALGLVSMSLLAPAWWRLVPTVKTGASLFYLGVHGEGSSGYLGHDRSGWFPGWFAAAGVDVVVSSHILVQASGGAMLLLREPQVFIDRVEVARTGHPAWLGTASLAVTF